MWRFGLRPKQKNVGADSISARQQADDLRAHIECAPTEAENFERCAGTANHQFYYLLSIIFYLLSKKRRFHYAPTLAGPGQQGR